MNIENKMMYNTLKLIAEGKLATFQEARLAACDVLEAVEDGSMPKIQAEHLLDDEFTTLLNKMLLNPENRITAQRLIEWFYIRGIDLTFPIEDRKPKRKRL